MKKIITLLFVIVAIAVTSCSGPHKIIAYDFRSDYVNNTINTRIFTKHDTLYFGDLTQGEFESFIHYYIISTYRQSDSTTVRK